jgi:hypothetical protein
MMSDGLAGWASGRIRCAAVPMAKNSIACSPHAQADSSALTPGKGRDQPRFRRPRRA